MTTYNAGPYTTLLAQLIARGFIVMGNIEDPDRFGNELLLLRKGEVRIRFVRDRGRWFLELAAPGSDDWFSPAVWQALLDDALPPDRLLTDQEQSNLLTARLAEIETVHGLEPVAVAELLRSWQAARAAARRARSLDG